MRARRSLRPGAAAFALVIATAGAGSAAAAGEVPATAVPAAALTAAGDARVGEALFVGSRRLTNGGAPCLGCHGVAGHGLAQAASFGPDLTGAYEAFGDALADTLESLPFPSMEPIYGNHAVTEPERLHLTAFLREVSGGEPPQLGGGFAMGVAGAAAAFLALVLTVGRRRAS